MKYHQLEGLYSKESQQLIFRRKICFFVLFFGIFQLLTENWLCGGRASTGVVTSEGLHSKGARQARPGLGIKMEKLGVLAFSSCSSYSCDVGSVRWSPFSFLKPGQHRRGDRLEETGGHDSEYIEADMPINCGLREGCRFMSLIC